MRSRWTSFILGVAASSIAAAAAACGTLLDLGDEAPSTPEDAGNESAVVVDGSVADSTSPTADGAAKDAATCTADTMNDFRNCGACGTECNSQHCTLGLCDPVVFATSTAHTGALGGAAGADSICRMKATSAGYVRPNNFWAWVSNGTAGTGPFSRGLKLGPRPLWRPHGTMQVALLPADLYSGTLAVSILQDETGATAMPPVFTDLAADGGFVTDSCGKWTATTGVGLTGDPTSTSSTWAAGGNANVACVEPHPIYCFEGTEP